MVLGPAHSNKLQATPYLPLTLLGVAKAQALAADLPVSHCKVVTQGHLAARQAQSDSDIGDGEVAHDSFLGELSAELLCWIVPHL